MCIDYSSIEVALWDIEAGSSEEEPQKNCTPPLALSDDWLVPCRQVSSSNLCLMQ